jgi:hypothetical protein
MLTNQKSAARQILWYLSERKHVMKKEFSGYSFGIGYIEIFVNNDSFGPVSVRSLTPFVGSLLQDLPGAIIKSEQNLSSTYFFINKHQQKIQTIIP